MIAYLKGKVLQKSVNYIILENLGVGYKVFATPEILAKKIQDNVEVYIYHKSTDDGESLFGLPDFKALEFFELLLTVTGVGPKSALGILSSAKIEILENAIINQDHSMFTKMSGVGKKTAERIILELKNKVMVGSLGKTGSGSGEVFDALIQLGYSSKEVKEALNEIDHQLSTDKQLKQALKLLSR